MKITHANINLIVCLQIYSTHVGVDTVEKVLEHIEVAVSVPDLIAASTLTSGQVLLSITSGTERERKRYDKIKKIRIR